MDQKINVSEFLGKRTLITGDISTGKTSFTRKILEEMCRHHLAARITVIDLAPEIPGEVAVELGLKGIGGELLPPEGKDIVYLTTFLNPPRLSSKSEEEAISIAVQNAKKIEDLFIGFSRCRRDIFFVNDISLYLQAGSAQKLMEWMEKASTIVVNGYYGERLGSGILSQREKKEMQALGKFFHIRIQMPEIIMY